MKNLLVLISFILIFFNSCKKEIIPADNVELGKEYFPLTTGHYIEYEIDSIIFNDFTKTIDTFKMEFRDEVGEKFTDNEGRESYVINRTRREDSTYNWEDMLTFYATKSNFNVEVIEDNLRMIKLVFPVKANTRWYGNAYIPTLLNSELQWLDKWDYKYTSINKPYNNGVQIFQDALEVSENDYQVGNPDVYPDDFAAKIYSKEVYAKNVGLIYKELTNWEYQPTVQKWRKGFTVYYRAKKSN